MSEDPRPVPPGRNGVRTEPHAIVQPEGWPRPSGYAHAVTARGRMMFLAGQVGWDPLTEKVTTGDMAEQVRLALDNVVAVLRAAGAEPKHVTRLVWYVTDLVAYARVRPAIGEIFRERFGDRYPAMSVVQVAALLEPRARVEIEATAVLPE